jgi:integrase
MAPRERAGLNVQILTLINRFEDLAPMGFLKITLDYEKKMLSREKIPNEAMDAILTFVDDLQLENISEIRRINYMQRLRVVARWIPEGFVNPTRNDIRTVRMKLADGYRQWTVATYFTMLKKFYRRTLPKDRFEEIFQDVKVNRRPDTHIKPDQMISAGEMERLLEACNSTRDRALVSLLYDSGCRVGEIATLRISDVTFDSYGAVIRVTGKTGFRNVRIVGNSIAHLKAWISDHPRRNDPDSIVFVNISRKLTGRPMTYDDIRMVLKRTAERAGIRRRIYPHLFRHTRATILAGKAIGNAPLENQMGWILGSRQTRTYVHLSGKEQDNAILKAYGIEVQDNDAMTEARPKACPRCNEPNDTMARFCWKCGMLLDTAVTEEMIRRGATKIEKEVFDSGVIDAFTMELINSIPVEERYIILGPLLEKIMKSPEKRERFLDKIDKMKGEMHKQTL